MKEFVLKAAGYRKLGCFDRPDTNERLGKNVKAEKKESHFCLSSLPVGLICTETLDQKRTNRCTAYGLAKVVSIMATQRLRKQVFIDPVEIWMHQLETGATEVGGDSLQNPLRQLIKHGVSFFDYDPVAQRTTKRMIQFEDYVRIFPEDFSKWLKDLHPIFTGITVYDDFIVDGVIDMTGKKRGGHAIPIVGEGDNYFRVENSWGDRWGIDGTCLLKKEDTTRLMSSYCLVGMSVS